MFHEKQGDGMRFRHFLTIGGLIAGVCCGGTSAPPLFSAGAFTAVVSGDPSRPGRFTTLGSPRAQGKRQMSSTPLEA